MQFPVTKYVFHRNQVIYVTPYNGNAYMSFHNRAAMTDEEAQKAFHREHNAEVLSLIVENKNNHLLINQDGKR